MTFLKKLGSVILKLVSIAGGFQPLIQQQVPGAAGAVASGLQSLELIAAIITNVEAMGQTLKLAGPDKLKAATPLVAQVVLQSSLLVRQKIADPALFTEGCSKVADGVVAILNSLHESGVKQEDMKA